MATVESGRLTGRRASDWGTISARLIDRAELLAALDRAVTHKVTVISAPAGSGKTSLLRAWTDRPRQAHRVAFVTVRRDQRDEQLFWLALHRAIRETVDEGDTDEPLIATPGFNAEAMVDRMLAYLADYPGRLVLVLDDLHELDSAGVQTYLTRLLTELPAQVHAVLGTRRDLRLRLHQLRLAGDLAELRAADLHFTEAERARFWRPPVWSCPTGHWQHCINEPKGGQPEFTSRRSHWRSIPTRSDSSGDLLDALPRHETGHGALLIDILDVLHGASIAKDRPVLPPTQELTPTELRVLRFLPTNMSRTEIARELYPSVNTVNTHVRNIYAKLDARDRSTAVERARELRLIASSSVAH